MNQNELLTHAHQMYAWATHIFPWCRSLTGAGLRQTLSWIKSIHPELKLTSIPSGTRIFDWIVPDEWNIHDAYIADTTGKRLIDFHANNLHVLGYSEPINNFFTRAELNNHLHTLPEYPDAIPYVTSYYRRQWGFCLSENQKNTLGNGPFHAVIDSELKAGHLNYGEIIIQGKTQQEILLSTYICHPSMANNEVSGIVLACKLAEIIKAQPQNRYTYRILFLPETIGAIAYLSEHLNYLKQQTVAGYVITCVGDDRQYSFLPSRHGNTLADRAAKHVLKKLAPDFISYSYLERGSDERQYCSPHVDLPVASIMRTKYAEYPEYHTSLDNLDLISPQGLSGSLQIYTELIQTLEANCFPRMKFPCEPQLGRRGLYPANSTPKTIDEVFLLTNLVGYADGKIDLIDLSDLIKCSIHELQELTAKLHKAGIFELAYQAD